MRGAPVPCLIGCGNVVLWQDMVLWVLRPGLQSFKILLHAP